ncbi:MAG: DUF4136 domain-containing protein [Burkholderia sp.]
MKTIRAMGMIGAGCAVALLAGCAAPTTGVSVTGQPAGFGAAGQTYELTRTDAQDGNAHYARVETLVRDALARDGYRLADAGQAARYRLAIAYATQPAALALGAPCPPDSGPCSDAPGLRVDGSAPFPLPFAGPVYRHLLTLRFVDRSSGATAYQVTAAARDRQPDALAAMPLLVRSALAKLPFDAARGWVVKTRPDPAGGLPGVVSVKPAATAAAQ